MNYDDFFNKLKNWITGEQKYKDWKIDFFNNGYTSNDEEELDFIRNTNLKYSRKESDILIGDFMRLKLPGEKRPETESTCRFELKYLYDSYVSDGWDFVEKIIAKNVEVTKNINENILSCIDDYDAVSNKLILRPFYFPANRDKLVNNIFRREGDIALVLYLMVMQDEDNLGSMRLVKDQLEAWGKTREEVLDFALANSNINFPPRIYCNPIESENPPYHKGAFMALNSDITGFKDDAPLLLTCTRQENGAVGFFYNGVRERISKLWGNADYYVVFTSSSEVWLHKEGYWNPRELLRKLKAINADYPDEVLSNKVYRFHSKTGELEMLNL